MAKELQQLKCGGKKKKKFAYGGSAGGAAGAAGLGSVIGSLGDSVTKTGVDHLETMKDPMTDNRINPYDALQKNRFISNLQSMIGGTGAGFSAGSSAGGWGMLGGAIVGALTSGITTLVKQKEMKRDIEKQTKDWSNSWNKITTDAVNKESYKDGGEKISVLPKKHTRALKQKNTSFAEGGPKLAYNKTITPLMVDGEEIKPTDPRYKAMYEAKKVAGYNKTTGEYSAPTLPEVSITAERKKTLATKIAEESKGMSLGRLMTTGPAEMILGAPQLLTTKAITGKYQRPSEAMRIKNKIGAIATDIALDPMNFVGAGLLAKSKRLFSSAKKGKDISTAVREVGALRVPEDVNIPRLTEDQIANREAINAYLRDPTDVNPEGINQIAREEAETAARNRFTHSQIDPDGNPLTSGADEDIADMVSDHLSILDEQAINRVQEETVNGIPQYRYYRFENPIDFRMADDEWDNVYSDIMRDNLGEAATPQRMMQERTNFFHSQANQRNDMRRLGFQDPAAYHRAISRFEDDMIGTGGFIRPSDRDSYLREEAQRIIDEEWSQSLRENPLPDAPTEIWNPTGQPEGFNAERANDIASDGPQRIINEVRPSFGFDDLEYYQRRIYPDDQKIGEGLYLRKKKNGGVEVFSTKNSGEVITVKPTSEGLYTTFGKMNQRDAGRAMYHIKKTMPIGTKFGDPGSLSPDSWKFWQTEVNRGNLKVVDNKGYVPINNMGQNTKAAKEMGDYSVGSEERAQTIVDELNSLIKDDKALRVVREGTHIRIPDNVYMKLKLILGPVIGTGIGIKKSQDMKTGYKDGGSIKSGYLTKRRMSPDYWITEYSNEPQNKLAGMDKMANGGKVTGAGSPKSDSIVKKVEDGSFIVPTENSKIAMSFGKEYLGWNDKEQASRNYPGTQVKLSNGEVLFTPEEVGILSYHGVNLDQLAPNAENSSNGFDEGGKKDSAADPNRYANATYDKFSMDMRKTNPDLTDLDIQSAFDKKYKSNQSVEPTKDNPDEKTWLQKLGDMAPEIAGALQAGAAVAGMRKAGAMPDVNVSNDLKQLAIQARRNATYGLEPGAKNAMLNAAENARRDTTNAVVNRGGSASELMSNLQGILATTIGEKYKTELMDVSEKARKQGRVDSLVTQLAGQNMDVQKIALMNWKDVQEANAGLLSAGISNIIGARKLKSEMEMMSNIKKKGQLSIDIGGKQYPINNK